MKNKFGFFSRSSGMKLFICLFVVLLSFSCNSGQKNKTDSSEQFKVRAIWVDPPGYADKETVDRFIEKCKKARINMLLPDVMIRDNIYFKSENFRGKVNADDKYDPLGYLIEKAHSEGIEVHPWTCTYYSEPGMPDWKVRPIASGNYDVSYISPANPEVNPYLLSVFEDLMKYDIDGLHLDYIRYWNAAYDYSDAARNGFNKEYGFDPINFLDYPEKIVSAEKDLYPVRVLLSETSKDRIPQLGMIERNMNRSYPAYAFVSEDSEKIDKLRIPGMLIVTCYTDFSKPIIESMMRYAERGGDILWIDPLPSLYDEYPEWGRLSGVSGVENMYHRPQVINPTDSKAITEFFEPVKANTRWNKLLNEESEVIAMVDDLEAVATFKKTGKGSITTFGFQILGIHDPEMIQFLTDFINVQKENAGVKEESLLAEKREEWIYWRSTHINDLVRSVNKMVKAKDPGLKVTAAAGIGPQQFYGIYRDAGDWLDENLCDFIFPMNYSDNIPGFLELLEEQNLFMTESRFERIYPGLQIYKRGGGKVTALDADIVKQQLKIIKEEGFQGFCLFAYSYFSDEIADVLESFN